MNDIRQKSLNWLYRQLRDKKISLGRAERKYSGSCEECQEIKDLRAKIEIIEWLIDAALKVR